MLCTPDLLTLTVVDAEPPRGYGTFPQDHGSNLSRPCEYLNSNSITRIQ